MSMGQRPGRKAPVLSLAATMAAGFSAMFEKAEKAMGVPRHMWGIAANWVQTSQQGYYRWRHPSSTSKYKPHQGKAECARRVRQGCRGSDPRSGNRTYNKLMMRLANDVV